MLNLSRYLVLGQNQHDSFIVVDLTPPHRTFLVHKKVYETNSLEIGCVYLLAVRFCSDDAVKAIRQKFDKFPIIGKSAFMARSTLTISDPKKVAQNRSDSDVYFRVGVNCEKHEAILEAITPLPEQREAAQRALRLQNNKNRPKNKPSSTNGSSSSSSAAYVNGSSTTLRSELPSEAVEPVKKATVSVRPVPAARNVVSMMSADEKKMAAVAFAKLYENPTIQLIMKNHPQELETIFKYFNIVEVGQENQAEKAN